MQDGVTMLVSPLPGVRVVDREDPEKDEDGSVLGLRKNGEEVLFAPWSVDDRSGMKWIPVSEFSPEPESIMPPEILPQEPGEMEPSDAPATEKPVAAGPFGNKGGLRRRPELDR